MGDAAFLFGREIFMNLKVFALVVILFTSFKANAQDIFKNEEQRQAAFQLLLSDELREIYDNIFNPSEKENWEQKYWKVFDPTPGTEKNEIYQQFIERFSFAEKYYSNIIAPLYLDDRGRYCVKYGEPDDKVISMGVGKPYRDNETWAYYKYNLYIDFVDQIGFGYREVPNLLDAITTGPSNIKTQIAADLYVERETLHQKYLSFRDIVDGSAGIRSDALFYQITRDLITEKKLAMESAPPSEYDYHYNKEQLDAHFSSAVFRGSNKLSRVEFYYSFPLNQLNFQEGSQIPYESFIEKQMTIFDLNFNKIMQKNETLKLMARNEREIEKRIYINQHTEELPPGLYNMALQLDSPESKRLAILKAQLKVKDFSDDSLTISDIQFSPQIREGISNQKNLKPNNLLIVPYVGNTIRRINPIYIYFEIYNLTLNQEGKSRFRVAYEVRSISNDNTSAFASTIQFITHLIGKKSGQKIGSSFETEGNNEFQQIYLNIDFSKFPAGSSSLTVSITDLENGTTTSGIKRFLLK